MQTKSKLMQTEIGLIPDTWEIKNVGDFVNIKHGYAFKGEYFSDEPTKNILLTPGNFKIGGGFKGDKLKYTTEKPSADYVLKENDIIVTMTDLSKEGDTLGYSAKVPYSDENKYLHNQRIGLLNFKSEKINSDFLYWVLRTKKYNSFIVGSATGSTVKHTSPDRIKQYVFGVPNTLIEQATIAKILSDLDAEIEINQQMNKTLEAIGQAIFNSWFVNFDFLDEKNKPYKSSGGEMVEEEHEEIPKGWKIGKIGEIIENFDSKRIPLSSREREKKKGIYPYYGAASILGYIDEYLFDGVYLLLGEDGTVVTANGTPLLQYVWGKFWVNNHAHVLKGKSPFSTEFLYFWFRQTNVTSIITGAVQPKINQQNLNSIPIIIPKMEIVKKFDRLIINLFEKYRLNVEEIKRLTILRDSLLPKLMSGQIRVE